MWLLLLAIGCATADFQAVLEEAVEDWELPGATAVVREADEVIFEGSSGVSDRQEETPMTPEDRFRIGSLTKPFTAVLVHQLDQEGILSLDDPVGDWVEEVPNGEHVTLRHLLGHTSGLGDFVDHDTYWTTAETAWAIDDLLALAFQNTSGDPGERGDYSNAGYILLGLALEGATGMAWEELVRLRITDPLALESTGLFSEGPEPARGYQKESGAVVDTTDHLHSENSWAAGALVSTAPDLAAFADGLWRGDLLDAEHLALLLVPNPTTGSTDWFRSLGLRIDLEEGEVNVGHQGKSIGYRGDWSTRAGRETTIVVLHNGGWVGARSLTNRLWDEHDRARP